MPNYTLTAVTAVTVVVAGAEVSRLAAIKAGKPNNTTVMGPVLGGFTLGLFLFAAGIANEYLASLFCLLLIIGSLLVNGTALFTVLTPAK
jgi:hypothetical protein